MFSDAQLTMYEQPRPGYEPADNSRNAILLRSDIHTSFDYQRFAFAPKFHTPFVAGSLHE